MRGKCARSCAPGRVAPPLQPRRGGCDAMPCPLCPFWHSRTGHLLRILTMTLADPSYPMQFAVSGDYRAHLFLPRVGEDWACEARRPIWHKAARKKHFLKEHRNEYDAKQGRGVIPTSEIADHETTWECCFSIYYLYLGVCGSICRYLARGAPGGSLCVHSAATEDIATGAAMATARSASNASPECSVMYSRSLLGSERPSPSVENMRSLAASRRPGDGISFHNSSSSPAADREAQSGPAVRGAGRPGAWLLLREATCWRSDGLENMLLCASVDAPRQWVVAERIL